MGKRKKHQNSRCIRFLIVENIRKILNPHESTNGSVCCRSEK